MTRTKLDLRTLIADRFDTYEALGREVGLSKQAVADYVSGHRDRHTTRYAIAAALGVALDDIAWPDRTAA